jgi:ABC-2 type transport system permease protein
MSGFFVLVRKHFGEAKWVLGLSIVPLFGLGWLLSFSTGRTLSDPVRQERLRRFAEARGEGNPDLPSALQQELFLWILPPVMLPLLIWAIGRGSLAVAGELERGTLDLTLSRPIRRSTYLMSQVVLGLVGLALIAGGLVGGHVVGNLVHKVPGAPSIGVWFRPWANFVALGFAIFGYSLLASSVEVVRWRAMTFGAVITLLSVIAQTILAPLEVMKPYRKYIENASVFKRYDPFRAASMGKDFGFDISVLFAVGGICILMGLLFFSRRDLPSSAG